MLSQLAVSATLSGLLAVVLSLPMPDGGSSAGICNVGSVQCCNAVGSTTDQSFTNRLPVFLQSFVKDLDVVVGIDCSPITFMGISGSSTCDAAPVCCDDNSNGGLISIGCAPAHL